MVEQSLAVANGPRGRHVIFGALGICLGATAFLVDALTNDLGLALLPLVSSGFSWGLAALAAGRCARSPRAGALTAAATLVLATISYYVLTLAVSRRWDLGVSLDGSSNADSGLRSAFEVAALWLLASVGAGVALGVLGYAIGRAPRLLGAIAGGAALGLLAGQGAYQLFDSVRAAVSYGFVDQTRIAQGAAELMLPVLLVIGLYALQRSGKSWLAFSVTGICALGGSTVIWSVISQMMTCSCLP